MEQPVISLKSVTKTYGTSRGIMDVSLDVQAGEVFGFLGPNGAGKSTTIRTMLDLQRADSGSITILGQDSRTDSVAIHHRVGYLSGDMETDPGLTGSQYLDYVGHLHGRVDSKLRQSLVNRLDCELDKKIRHLSRGNKQKIGLVAALMHRPDILILDEPTSGLDPLSQAIFNTLIKEHVADGKAAFISSHILSEIQSICDRVGFIRQGRLIDVQPLADLLRQSLKRVRAVYRDETAIPKKLLAGAENQTTTKATVTFDYKGDPAQLLTWLSQQPLVDVYVQEADLEELFMHYYKEDVAGAKHV